MDIRELKITDIVNWPIFKMKIYLPLLLWYPGGGAAGFVFSAHPPAM